jgi:hypothetical protein
VVTVKLGLGVLPQRPHQRHVLADDRAPAGRLAPVVRQFRHVPPVSHAEREPAAGDEVERGDRLRQRDRVMLGNERYAGPDLQVGLRGDDGQRDVRVERPAVTFRQVARVGRLRADRDVGVLRQQDRVEAALGGRAGEVGDRQGQVGREVVQGGQGTGPVSCGHWAKAAPAARSSRRSRAGHSIPESSWPAHWRAVSSMVSRGGTVSGCPVAWASS